MGQQAWNERLNCSFRARTPWQLSGCVLTLWVYSRELRSLDKRSLDKESVPEFSSVIKHTHSYGGCLQRDQTQL